MSLNSLPHSFYGLIHKFVYISVGFLLSCCTWECTIICLGLQIQKCLNFSWVDIKKKKKERSYIPSKLCGT